MLLIVDQWILRAEILETLKLLGLPVSIGIDVDNLFNIFYHLFLVISFLECCIVAIHVFFVTNYILVRNKFSL